MYCYILLVHKISNNLEASLCLSTSKLHPPVIKKLNKNWKRKKKMKKSLYLLLKLKFFPFSMGHSCTTLWVLPPPPPPFPCIMDVLAVPLSKQTNLKGWSIEGQRIPMLWGATHGLPCFENCTHCLQTLWVILILSVYHFSGTHEPCPSCKWCESSGYASDWPNPYAPTPRWVQIKCRLCKIE